MSVFMSKLFGYPSLVLTNKHFCNFCKLVGESVNFSNGIQVIINLFSKSISKNFVVFPAFAGPKNTVKLKDLNMVNNERDVNIL